MRVFLRFLRIILLLVIIAVTAYLSITIYKSCHKEESSDGSASVVCAVLTADIDDESGLMILLSK